TGELVSLNAQSANIKGEKGERSFPISSLLELKFTAQKADDPNLSKAASLSLSDGSHIACSELSATARTVKCTSPHLGKFEVAPSMVASIRLGPVDDRVEADWQKLLQRTLKRDLLVVRKGDVLDYQDGIVGDIDNTLVKFSLDGEEIPIKREKVFGVVF